MKLKISLKEILSVIMKIYDFPNNNTAANGSEKAQDIMKNNPNFHSRHFSFKSVIFVSI